MNGWLKTGSVCTPSSPARAKPAPFEKLSSHVGVKAQKNAGGSKFVPPLYDFKKSQRLQFGTQSLKAGIRQLCSFIFIRS